MRRSRCTEKQIIRVLNADARIDLRDAVVRYQLVDRMDADPDLDRLVGGPGKYGSTAALAPFTHLDPRGYPARW